MSAHYNNYDIGSNFKSTNGLPRIPPNASFWKHFRRKCHLLILASRHTPDSNFYIRSQAAFIAERMRQYTSYWYVIHPLSIFRMYWKILMFVVWMVLLPCDIFLPAFAIRLYEEGNFRLLHLYKVMFVMNCVCNVDVLLNFFTGYIDEKLQIVLSVKQMARQYVCSYWLVDMLSFTHLVHRIITGTGRTDSTRFRIAYSLQFLRLLRLRTALENMKIISDKCRIGETVYFVLHVTILGLYLVHFNACVLCQVLDAVQSFAEEERMSLINQLYYIYEASDRALIATDIYAHCIFEVLNKYSMHYVTTDLQPIELEDKIMTIFTNICAISFNVYLFMKVLYRMNLAYTSSISYDVAQDQLQQFMTMYGFPEDLQNEFLEDHELFYKKEYYDENLLMNSLGPAQKADIFIHFYKNFLQKSKLFQNVPLWQVEALMKNMKWYCLRPGNEISINWRTNITYFVISGSLACYSEIGAEVCHYIQGDSFGFHSEHWRRGQCFTMVAIETCELCQISGSDLHRARISITKRPTIFFNM